MAIEVRLTTDRRDVERVYLTANRIVKCSKSFISPPSLPCIDGFEMRDSTTRAQVRKAFNKPGSPISIWCYEIKTEKPKLYGTTFSSSYKGGILRLGCCEFTRYASRKIRLWAFMPDVIEIEL